MGAAQEQIPGMNHRQTTPKREIRTYKAEIRTAEDGAAPKIAGYAAVYDAYSEDMGGWYERIAPGAFSDVLAGADIRALINHDPNMVLGRSKSGTLTCREDNTGLNIEITPPDVGYANDLLTSMQRGDIDQMSFAFIVSDANWDETRDGLPVRTITGFQELFDVSVVTYPAYPTTSASVRSNSEVFADYESVQPPDNGAGAEIRAKKLILRGKI